MWVPELFETTDARAANGIDDTLADLEDLKNEFFLVSFYSIILAKKLLMLYLWARLDLLILLCRFLVSATFWTGGGGGSGFASTSLSTEVPSSIPGIWVAPGNSLLVAKKAANKGELGGCNDESKELKGKSELNSVVDPLDES